jgi:dCMP deaminase
MDGGVNRDFSEKSLVKAVAVGVGAEDWDGRGVAVSEGLESKYLYVCHAEFNAILNTRGGAGLKNCTIYVTLFPCNECAKAIIQTGIKHVVYLDDKYHDHIEEQASRKLLDMSGVTYSRYTGRAFNISVK